MTQLRNLDLGPVSTFALMSDIHLRDPEHPTTQLFIKALQELEGVEVLFLAGDIFDFIFVAKDFFQKMWKDVFDALEELRKKGVRVIFIEGNHDFGFEHFFPASLRTAFHTAGDLIAQCKHPHLGLVEVRHGDDVICPPHYRHFRRLVKGRFLQSALSILPGFLMHLAFSNYAKLSRKKDKYRTLSSPFLTSCIDSYYATENQLATPDVLLLGHIHVYLDANIGKIRVLSGTDWMTHPNILLCDEQGRLSRTFLNNTVPEKFDCGRVEPSGNSRTDVKPRKSEN